MLVDRFWCLRLEFDGYYEWMRCIDGGKGGGKDFVVMVLWIYVYMVCMIYGRGMWVWVMGMVMGVIFFEFFGGFLWYVCFFFS